MKPLLMKLEAPPGFDPGWRFCRPCAMNERRLKMAGRDREKATPTLCMNMPTSETVAAMNR